jgi:hypothetical protein
MGGCVEENSTLIISWMASIKDLVFTLRIGTANIFPVNV